MCEKNCKCKEKCNDCKCNELNSCYDCIYSTHDEFDDTVYCTEIKPLRIIYSTQEEENESDIACGKFRARPKLETNIENDNEPLPF